MARITSITALRALYPPPSDRAYAKQMPRLERHSRRFIELSPFCVIATQGGDGHADASPRGDGPGFVKILSDSEIAIPDRPGNNRLDTLENIVADPAVGLLFLIPGVNEILRVNGRAALDDDEELRARFPVQGRLPRLVIRVAIEEVYLHCAKAIMRSRLWEPETLVPRTVLPTMGEMLHDQTGGAVAPEGQEAMEARYREILY